MMTEQEFLELAEIYHECAVNSKGKLAEYYMQQMWKVMFLAEGYDGDFFDPNKENQKEGQAILAAIMEDWWRGNKENRYGSMHYKKIGQDLELEEV